MLSPLLPSFTAPSYFKSNKPKRVFRSPPSMEIYKQRIVIYAIYVFSFWVPDMPKRQFQIQSQKGNLF
jgi:hypothetical protein